MGFASAKDRQNAFQTAIRSTGCPESVKAEWQKLSKLGRFNQQRQDFVTEVATVIGGNYSEIVVKIEASLGTETKSGSKGGYVSYERFTGIHGKTKADELIRLKAVHEIEDDELPAGHTYFAISRYTSLQVSGEGVFRHVCCDEEAKGRGSGRGQPRICSNISRGRGATAIGTFPRPPASSSHMTRRTSRDTQRTTTRDGG